MARSFKDAIAQRNDPLQAVDETVPGFIPDPSTYFQPTPGGARRARTFSQTIADATRGVDAGMNRFTPQKLDLGSMPGVGNAKPDWRGHYDAAQAKPTPRAALQLQTYPENEIKPLTLAERMKMGKRVAPALPSTLYVHRPLTNAQQLWDWANNQGIPNLVPPHEMHATQVYSRKPVELEPRQDVIIAKRRIGLLGDKGAVVLHFDSPEMQARHQEAMAAGASHDWPTFQTHVTLSYDGDGRDYSAVPPPDFPLEFGPEIHAPLNDNWAEEKGLRKGAPGLPHPHVGGDRLKLPRADWAPRFQPPRTNVKPSVGPERRLFEPAALGFGGRKPKI